MANPDKLLRRVISSPNNVKFEDLCRLAESYGWIFQRQSGSHRIYLHPDLGNALGSMMNLQPRRGKAKPTQVKQLIDAIDSLDHD